VSSVLHRGDYDDDWEDESEADEEETVPCPYCGAPVHEDAQRCPHCEHYISEEDRPATRRPWWIILGALAVLYLVYRWTVG